MNLIKENGFTELSSREMNEVNGGGVWEAAIALVGAAGTALVGGFYVGRKFVRDIRNKWF